MHLVDRSMDEDDDEILENVMTDIYFDADSVPRVVVVQSEELADAARHASTSRACAVDRSRCASPNAASAVAWSRWRRATRRR